MGVSVITGDCREELRQLPPKSVHCCVTSPPYFGLRDYGNVEQIGLEPTPDEFVSALVGVFREVRRVLRDDGTVWLNLGDSYTGSGKGGNPENSPHNKQATNRGSQTVGVLYGRTDEKTGGSARAAAVENVTRKTFDLGPKQLLGIPWRVAFALQADGWYLRQDIIWHKPNPMPESVRDRCTKAHEYVFLLSKSPRYFFDQEAILEPSSPNTHARLSQNVQEQVGSERAHAGQKTNGAMKAVGRKFDPGKGNKNNPSFDAAMAIMPDKRNKRSVWTVPTRSYKEAHFATYPPDLIEPCIKAGCPAGGTVLDPFGGAGTTGLVADRLQRNAVLIELNPEYAQMARDRITKDSGLFGGDINDTA